MNRHQVRVFISSAMQELDSEREIAQEALKHVGMEPTAFEFFPSLSYSPMEACLEKVRECDIFVLILWRTLRPAVKAELAEAVKYCKPILFFLKLSDDNLREEKAAQLLADINAPDAAFAVVYRKFRGLSELRESLRDSVAEETAKLYRMPDVAVDKAQMYGLGTDIVRHAKRRLCVFQQTPSLLLGARPYFDEDRPLCYERELLDMLKQWIELRRDNADCQFLCLYSLQATRKEIEAEVLLSRRENAEKLRERIYGFRTLEHETGGRFMVKMTESRVSGPHIVGDDRFAVWLFGGNDAVAIGVSVSNGVICP